MSGLDEITDIPALPSVVDTRESQQQRRQAAQRLGEQILTPHAMAEIADFFPGSPQRSRTASPSSSSHGTPPHPSPPSRRASPRGHPVRASKVCFTPVCFFTLFFFSVVGGWVYWFSLLTSHFLVFADLSFLGLCLNSRPLSNSAPQSAALKHRNPRKRHRLHQEQAPTPM
jgi:hypothetical protein